MHELGIANAVLEAVRAELVQYPGARAKKVCVRLGELAGVDADALSFCFEALVRDTDFDSLNLEIEPCPRRHRCAGCGDTFRVHEYATACPACGSLQTECISGEELELAYLEVEQP